MKKITYVDKKKGAPNEEPFKFKAGHIELKLQLISSIQPFLSLMKLQDKAVFELSPNEAIFELGFCCSVLP